VSNNSNDNDKKDSNNDDDDNKNKKDDDSFIKGFSEGFIRAIINPFSWLINH